MKKLICIMLALILTGCSTIKKHTPNYSENQNPNTNVSVVEPPLDEIENSYVEFSARLEAENGQLMGSLITAKERAGFSGKGYVTGFRKNQESPWSQKITLPASQHYNITVCAAVDSPKNNELMLDGNFVTEVLVENKTFTKYVFENVYVEKGEHTFSIRSVMGGIALDYVEIEANPKISELEFNPENNLINKNANDSTKKLMEFLSSSFGKSIISGQFVTIGTDAELELVKDVTGRYPAIRFGDLLPYTSSSKDKVNEIELARDWAEHGGIVGYIWHWEMGGSYYSEKSDFDLSKAVTQKDIARLSFEEIEQLYNDGEISEDTLKIIKGIDDVSKELKVLNDDDISVIWRPLHEAGMGIYWWGDSGKDAYKWLWKLLYERQTYYHELNNLIWVWNGQAIDWYVGDEWCDVISVDIYDEGSSTSKINVLLALLDISNKKPIALSECANLPSIKNVIQDRAFWTWASMWSGNYIMDEFGGLLEEYTTREHLESFYNSAAVTTRDELPVFRDSEL